ncbi:hypothetical protein P3L10_001341 [Capsicum annuum]
MVLGFADWVVLWSALCVYKAGGFAVPDYPVIAFLGFFSYRVMRVHSKRQRQKSYFCFKKLYNYVESSSPSVVSAIVHLLASVAFIAFST